jgi:Icc-related predicted phosphoesterase
MSTALKLFQVSDPHGDFETFDRAIEQVIGPVGGFSPADALLVTGDLVGPLFDREELEAFAPARDFVERVYQNTPEEIETRIQATEVVLEEEVPSDDEGRQAAETYLILHNIAKDKMAMVYGGFKQRFDHLKSEGLETLVIPGNWDGRMMPRVLADYDLHAKTKPLVELCPTLSADLQRFSIAGFGGSQGRPNKIPRDLVPIFQEEAAYEFLMSQPNADIVMTHAAPRNIRNGDKQASIYNGSSGVSEYMVRAQPSAMFVGDSHKYFVAQDTDSGTVVLSPGNLGAYDPTKPHGNFFEVDLDGNLNIHKLKLHNAAESEVRTHEVPITLVA